MSDCMLVSNNIKQKIYPSLNIYNSILKGRGQLLHCDPCYKTYLRL
jgi:hypothetical protein